MRDVEQLISAPRYAELQPNSIPESGSVTTIPTALRRPWLGISAIGGSFVVGVMPNDLPQARKRTWIQSNRNLTRERGKPKRSEQ